jgi:hypothetical protein
MRESKIEKDVSAAVNGRGGRAYKFVSPGRRGVPDRIMLMPVPEKHQEIVSKYIRFIEFKAPGKVPNLRQTSEIAFIRSIGFEVDILDHA